MSFTPGPGTTYLLTSSQPLPSGTANGVLYLNGSKVVSSGTRLQFDGNSLNLGSPTGTPSSGGFSIRLQDVGGDANDTGFGVDASANLWQNVAASGPAHIWYIGGTEQMRLNASGNLGIGTTSIPASQRLRIAGGDVGLEGQYLYLVNASAQIQMGAGQNARIVNTDSTNSLDIGRTGASSVITISTAGSERARIDSSGNLGLGVTPGTQDATVKSFQFGSWGNLYSNVDVIRLTSNSRLSGGNNIYLNSGPATMFQLYNGVHSWFNAASGTAGNPISFTQAMTLDASGNLVIGSTTSAGKINVVGAAYFGADTNNAFYADSTSSLVSIGAAGRTSFSTSALRFLTSDGTAALERARIDANGNFVINTAAIATNATNGFLYVPSCAGTPTGTPTTYTGRVPIVVDTTNNKLYFYSGGTWRDAGP